MKKAGMKKLGWILFIYAVCLLVLSACGQSEQPGSQMLRPQMIDVDLNVPEQVDVGELVTIEATVTLESEPVENADEVIYEIWEQGKRTEAERIEGMHRGNGVYAIDYTFDQNGVYYVVSHVTLREMHNMPRKRIIVGEVDPALLEIEEPNIRSMEELQHLQK